MAMRIPACLSFAALCGVLCAIGACAHRSELSGLDHGPPLNYGPACDSNRAIAIANPKATAIVMAKPLNIFVGPMPTPATARGERAVIDIIVDEYGHPVRDSVTVNGITDAQYRSKVRQNASQMLFRPGSVGGCAVRSAYRLTIDFGRR